MGHCLDALEARAGLAPGTVKIVPVATETAQAMLNTQSFVAPTEKLARLAGVTWGAEDLSSAIGAMSNRELDGERSGDWSPLYTLANSLCLCAAIGQNQGIQHPLAERWMALEAAWGVVMKGAWMYDQHQPCGAEANTAKFLGARAGFDSCTTAVLIEEGKSMFKRDLFNEDHEAFRDMVQRFIANEIAPHHAQREESGIVPRELWRKAGAAGMDAVARLREAAQHGGSARYHNCDVRDAEAIDAMVERIWAGGAADRAGEQYCGEFHLAVDRHQPARLRRRALHGDGRCAV